MKSLTDTAPSARRAAAGAPRLRAFGDADAGRVRIRGRNSASAPSAGSSPATSPRPVSPRRSLPSHPRVFPLCSESLPCAPRGRRRLGPPRRRWRRRRARGWWPGWSRRGGGAAARRRGWPSGDDARARETEAWLRRERASLGSFRESLGCRCRAGSPRSLDVLLRFVILQREHSLDIYALPSQGGRSYVEGRCVCWEGRGGRRAPRRGRGRLASPGRKSAFGKTPNCRHGFSSCRIYGAQHT